MNISWIFTYTFIFINFFTFCIVRCKIFGNSAALFARVRGLYKSSDIILIHDESKSGWQERGINAVKELTRMSLISQSITRNQLIKSYDKLSQSEHVTRPLMSMEITGPQDIEFLNTIFNPRITSNHAWLLVIAKEINCKPLNGNPLRLGIHSKLIVYCAGESTISRYNSMDGNNTNVTFLGTWTEKDGLNVTDTSLLYVKNLKGITLKIAETVSSKNPADNHLAKNSFVTSFFKELKNITNFTTVTSLSVTTTKGSSSNPIVEAVKTNQVDIGLFLCTVTTKRMKIVDFSIPIAVGQYRIFAKIPDEPEIRWYDAYFRMFAVKKSILWLAMLIVAIGILWFIRWFLKKAQFCYQSICDCVMDVWSIICLQGISESEIISRISVKIFYVSILALAIMLNYSYSAALMSYIVVLIPATSFDNYVELFSDTDFKITSLSYSATEYFLDKKFWMYDLIQPRLENVTKLPANVNKAIEQVCEEDVAFIANYLYFKASMTRLPCLVGFVTLPLSERIAIILAKDSPYTAIINYNIIRLYDTGIMKRLTDLYFYETIDLPKNIPLYLSFTEFLPVLIVWLIGVVASLIILYAEIVFYYWQSRKKRNLVSKSVRA